MLKLVIIQKYNLILYMRKYIGKNCFIGHGVIFINDKFKDGKPAGGDKKNGAKQP